MATTLRPYFVEFCAEAGDVRDVRGTVRVHVRHWSRARKAAFEKLRRMGWETVRVFRPCWIEPPPLPSISEEMGQVWRR